MEEIPQSAILHVTRFMKDLLRHQLAAAAPNLNPVVTLLPPGSSSLTSPGVNLYLYQVVESPFTKNQDWRGNRTFPPMRRPILGLQLSYLVTATAPENDENAHGYLGIAMSTFQNYPVLNDVHLPAVGNIPAVDADGLPPFIQDSYEQIKVTLLPTTVDMVSRIWATLNQPYRLSVAYEVSLVEIIPERPLPRRGDIVLETNLNVLTMGPPVVDELVPAAGALLTGQIDQTSQPPKLHLEPSPLTINGSRLLSQITKNDVPILGHPPILPVVRVGGKIVQIEEETLAPSDQSLKITLPLDLDAGPQIDIRVTLRGRSSAPTAFHVTPWLSRITPLRAAFKDSPFTLTLEGVGFDPGGSVLFINPANMTVAPSNFEPGGTDKSATAIIPATLANGLYDVRVRKIDGSVSNKRYLAVLPLVTKVIYKETVENNKPICTLKISGFRLTDEDKSATQVVIDGVTFGVPLVDPPVNPVEAPLNRKLDKGTHSLTFSIGGHVSPPFLFPVPTNDT